MTKTAASPKKPRVPRAPKPATNNLRNLILKSPVANVLCDDSRKFIFWDADSPRWNQAGFILKHEGLFPIQNGILLNKQDCRLLALFKKYDDGSLVSIDHKGISLTWGEHNYPVIQGKFTYDPEIFTWCARILSKDIHQVRINIVEFEGKNLLLIEGVETDFWGISLLIKC